MRRKTKNKIDKILIASRMYIIPRYAKAFYLENLKEWGEEEKITTKIKNEIEFNISFLEKDNLSAKEKLDLITKTKGLLWLLSSKQYKFFVNNSEDLKYWIEQIKGEMQHVMFP